MNDENLTNLRANLLHLRAKLWADVYTNMLSKGRSPNDATLQARVAVGEFDDKFMGEQTKPK